MSQKNIIWDNPILDISTLIVRHHQWQNKTKSGVENFGNDFLGEIAKTYSPEMRTLHKNIHFGN